jgi:hypothetical protein
MTALRNTGEIIANLRAASVALEPQPEISERERMKADAKLARQLAYALSPEKDTDQEELAGSVNELADAVHMLATVVLRILDESRGRDVL